MAHHASVVPVFGKPWETLSLNEVTAVLKDIAELADDEMEGDDLAAARELRTRIGGPSVIKSYAQSLVAGGRHLNPKSRKNPPPTPRRVRRAVASGRFAKARHYAASTITRGVRHLDLQRRAAGRGRVRLNPKGHDPELDEAVRRIRSGLKRRGGITWSVTRGTGSVYGWIYIKSPRGDMTADEQRYLAKILGLPTVHQQGVMIPSGSRERDEYVARAEGRRVANPNGRENLGSMFKVASKKGAENAAKQEGLSYGWSLFDGSWYVGTPTQLKRIGVLEPQMSNPKGRVPIDQATAAHLLNWLRANRSRSFVRSRAAIYRALRNDPEMIERGLGWGEIEARGEGLAPVSRPNRRPMRRNPLPRWVDPRSVRTVIRGETGVLIGCPKGRWSPTRRRCTVGTKALEKVRGKGRGNPRDTAMARARRTFRRMNEIEPGRVTRVRAAAGAPKVLAKLGELVSFTYRSDKYAGTPDNPSGRPQLYEHRTKRPHPVLATDPDGREVHIVGGRMHPTPDGLVN
jgi:hypothetical protein